MALGVGATSCPAWQECLAGRHELAKFRLRQVATEGCEVGAAPPPKGGAHECAKRFVNGDTEFVIVAVVSIAAAGVDVLVAFVIVAACKCRLSTTW